MQEVETRFFLISLFSFLCSLSPAFGLSVCAAPMVSKLLRLDQNCHNKINDLLFVYSTHFFGQVTYYRNDILAQKRKGLIKFNFIKTATHLSVAEMRDGATTILNVSQMQTLIRTDTHQMPNAYVYMECVYIQIQLLNWLL